MRAVLVLVLAIAVVLHAGNALANYKYASQDTNGQYDDLATQACNQRECLSSSNSATCCRDYRTGEGSSREVLVFPRDGRGVGGGGRGRGGRGKTDRQRRVRRRGKDQRLWRRVIGGGGAPVNPAANPAANPAPHPPSPPPSPGSPGVQHTTSPPSQSNEESEWFEVGRTHSPKDDPPGGSTAHGGGTGETEGGGTLSHVTTPQQPPSTHDLPQSDASSHGRPHAPQPDNVPLTQAHVVPQPQPHVLPPPSTTPSSMFSKLLNKGLTRGKDITHRVLHAGYKKVKTLHKWVATPPEGLSASTHGSNPSPHDYHSSPPPSPYHMPPPLYGHYPQPIPYMGPPFGGYYPYHPMQVGSQTHPSEPVSPGSPGSHPFQAGLPQDAHQNPSHQGLSISVPPNAISQQFASTQNHPSLHRVTSSQHLASLHPQGVQPVPYYMPVPFFYGSGGYHPYPAPPYHIPPPAMPHV